MKFIKGCLAVMAVLFVVGIIGAVIGGGDDTSTTTSNNTPAQQQNAPPKKKPVKQQPTMNVTASQLLKAYEDNELAADGKYTGKTAKITGFVKSIEKVFGSSFVTLGSGAQFEIQSVQAFFNKESESKLATLKKGQKLTITCLINGKSMNIEAKNCSF